MRCEFIIRQGEEGLVVESPEHNLVVQGRNLVEAFAKLGFLLSRPLQDEERESEMIHLLVRAKPWWKAYLTKHNTPLREALIDLVRESLYFRADVDVL